MAQVSGKLTDVVIRQAKKEKATYRKSDGKGLYIEVRPNGSKYWRMAYRFNGKQRTLALGVYPDVGLSEARKGCTEARKLLRKSIDPVFEKRQLDAERKAASENSFEAIAREWHENRKGGWSESHAKRILKWMEADLFPNIGKRPISEIKPAELLAVIKKIERRDALDVAKRQRARCSAIFKYAIQTGRASYDPAADLIGVVKSVKVVPRLSMSQKELGPFLRKLDTFDRIKPVTRLGLQLLVLTFVRPGEMRGALWEEFDLDAKEWRIPAERMKMGTEHVVPLSPQALAILEELKPLTGKSVYLFPSDRSREKPMSENAFSYAMKRMGYQGKATPHGFGATASTILNESGFKPDVIERQLAHLERDKVRAAYHRSTYLEDRKKMMKWWGNFLDGIKASDYLYRSSTSSESASNSPKCGNC